MDRLDVRELLRWATLANDQDEALAANIANAVARLFKSEEHGDKQQDVSENWEALRKRA